MGFFVGFFVGLFWVFYTDVTALTLVGCEVYSSTNNREKSISFCRYVYSSSQNVWPGAGSNTERPMSHAPFHYSATTHPNRWLIPSPASSTQTEKITPRSTPCVKQYWWWAKSGLMRDYQIHVYLTYPGNFNSLSHQLKFWMFWGKTSVLVNGSTATALPFSSTARHDAVPGSLDHTVASWKRSLS